MRKRGSNRILAAAVVAALLVGATACGGHAETPAPEGMSPIAVETAVAALEEVPRGFEAAGSVEPWTRVSPGTKILGRIERVSVREGDRVRKDQVLAAIEKRDLEAAVEQARAGVAMAEANLENARAQYDRMTALRSRGSVTDKNLEDATAGFRVANASLQQARANQAASEVTLGYAEVRSPIAGWVTEKRADAGDMASPGMSLFTVEDLSRVKIVVQVSESDVVALSVGDPAHVRVDVLDGRWEAVIERIVPSGDRMSRTYDVQLSLDNPEGRLKSGMFARASFPRGTREALRIPASAVVERGQLRGLFVVEQDGRARLRWIRLGRETQGRIEVLSGLGAGDVIVVTPPPHLSDGARVEAR